ncbi:MAG: hypothetical protein SangKO_000370 [Sandaracinaceae bacterium]|nr:hypothetical protein [Myxococcales bacterium]
MQEGIMSLPQDMKAILRIVEDPDLADEHRTLAAGALLHVLSGQNAIPGMRGMLAYVDDVIVLRLVLERLEKAAPEVMAQHREDSPELMEPLERQMQAVRAYLGELLAVLDTAVDGMPNLNHQGHAAGQCARDEESSTWLYDAVHEALIDELDFDEDEVARELKNVDTIKRPLELRLATP